jgi:hypothetical protein
MLMELVRLTLIPPSDLSLQVAASSCVLLGHLLMLVVNLRAENTRNLGVVQQVLEGNREVLLAQGY